MRAITAPETIFEITTELKKEDQSIGLVPTMGALHEGHLALIKKSTEGNDNTIVSIFVNPLQFENPEDIDMYPRSIKDDKAKLTSLGVDFLFEPSANELYKQIPQVSISFGPIGKVLEGKYRPGHFNGVRRIRARSRTAPRRWC